jgi:hypothetical protein
VRGRSAPVIVVPDDHTNRGEEPPRVVVVQGNHTNEEGHSGPLIVMPQSDDANGRRRQEQIIVVLPSDEENGRERSSFLSPNSRRKDRISYVDGRTGVKVDKYGRPVYKV